MMKTWKPLLVAASLAVGLSAAPALAGHGQLDDLRGHLMRLQIRLQYEAENAPPVLEAYKQACAAYSEMYKCREEVLTRVYQRDDYKDLRLALYHTQRKLAGYHEEIPLRVQHIMEGATSALAVRVQITRLEAAVLESDADYVQARDQANALYTAYRTALNDSLDTLKSNTELSSLVDQISGLQRSVTGMRSVGKIAAR